jgi:hypothetical protein
LFLELGLQLRSVFPAKLSSPVSVDQQSWREMPWKGRGRQKHNRYERQKQEVCKQTSLILLMLYLTHQ